MLPDPDPAHVELNEAIARAPKCAQAYIQRAKLEWSRNTQAMLQDAQTAVALDPGNAEAHALAGLAFRKPADADKALGEYSTALALGMKSPDLLTERADLFAYTGNFDLALADDRAAYDLYPQSPEPLTSVGLAYERAHQPDKAIAAFEDAIKRAPTSETAYFQLAMFYKSQGKADLALATETRGLEAIPASENLLHVRGEQYEAQNDLTAAIADYTALIAAAKGQAYPYAARAEAYLKSGQLDLALADANKSVHGATGYLVNEQPRNLEIRGLIYDARGEGIKALADYDDARSQMPVVADFQNAACWERSLLNVELDQALSQCNEANRLWPKRAEYLDSRGWVYYRLGRFDEASQDFTAALALRNTLASSRFGLAMVEQAKGQANEAQADFATARSLAPGIDKDLARFGPFAHN